MKRLLLPRPAPGAAPTRTHLKQGNDAKTKEALFFLIRCLGISESTRHTYYKSNCGQFCFPNTSTVIKIVKCLEALFLIMSLCLSKSTRYKRSNCCKAHFSVTLWSWKWLLVQQIVFSPLVEQCTECKITEGSSPMEKIHITLTVYRYQSRILKLLAPSYLAISQIVVYS